MRARIAGAMVAMLGAMGLANADSKQVANKVPADPKAVPRGPGVYPVLVVTRDDDDAHDRAYVLGCAKVTKSGSKLLGPKDCTSLLRGAKLELVQGATRTAVRATKKTGISNTCPERDQHERYVQLTGLPADAGYGLVVAPGVAELAADPKTEPAIEKVYPKSPGKAPGDDGWDIVGSFDLDGDGRAEVITEFLGRYVLWSGDAKMIGTVGCSLG